MSRVLENAKQHFKHCVENEGLRCIEVPAWGENNQPAKIYFKPLGSLTIKAYSQWVTLGSQQTVEAFVDMLILRCVDVGGQPLFKSVDRTEMLREISPIVVCDIISQMSESEKDDPKNVMTAAKND